MDAKATVLLAICFVALFGSFLYSMFTPIETGMLILPITIMTIVFFFFGVIGFGFASFVPYLLLGFAMGIRRDPILFIYLLPILIATYAGLKLGSTLLDDFRRKIYFTPHGKTIISLIVIAIIIAIALEFALPLISEMNFIPNDVFGTEIVKTKIPDMSDFLKTITK